MKRAGLIVLAVLVFGYGFSQSSVRKIPSVNVKTLDGRTINTSGISNEGKPIIISFWATWCKPCIRELDAIADVYEDWVEETGVQLIAVSIDDTRNTAKVSPFINGKGWEYKTLLDPNGGTDEFTSNDDMTLSFEGKAAEKLITFFLTTDGYASETSWDVKNSAGTVGVIGFAHS